MTASSVINNTADITLYAHWSVKAFTASWNTGTGYSITVNRTASPYAGASTGNISSGSTIYYGDVLNVTYTKADYYYLTSTGSTAITVSGNITSSNIYATAELNPIKGWIFYSDLPSGALVTSTKYTYTHRYFTTSASSSLSGWTQYDSAITSWTAWSAWSTWNPTNGVRQVDYRSVYDHTQYHYYRWTDKNHTGMYTYKNTEKGCTILEEKWFDYELPLSSGYSSIAYEGTDKAYNWWCRADYSGNSSVSKTYTRDVYRDEWRYQDPVYTYYFYQDRSEESTVAPPVNQDYRDVQTWVQYREK